MATKKAIKTQNKASAKINTKPKAEKSSAALTTAKKNVKSAITKRTRPKTLITGGTGFLGSHLVRQLIEAGAKDLRVMTTASASWLEESGVEIVTGSITNGEDVARAVKNVQAIYHLAGRVSREEDNARAMHDVHVNGTRLLCEAAKEAGVKSIVMASSSGTIAVTEKGDFIPDEDYQTPLDIISRWPYYASKFYQERVALESLQDKSCRLVILNPSLLLGPGDDRLSSTKVILDFLSRKLPITPSGGLSFVDARDAAAAFIYAMEKGRHGEKYLLGSVNWTFSKFFGRLERLTGVSAPLLKLPAKVAFVGSQLINSFYKSRNWASPVQPSEIKMAEYFWYLDSSKAERELNFTPRDPADTLQDSVKYVRQRFLGERVFFND